MAAYPTFTAEDVAGFTGRDAGTYPEPYTDNSAIPQAVLLFRLATGLVEWPDTADSAQLATFAIEQMADAFVLGQQYQEIAASPFQSETIGSYTYTKALKLLQAGQPTGLLWFDLAVQRLGISEDVASVVSGSLSLFERDALIINGKIFGPADLNKFDESMWSYSRPIPYDPNGRRQRR